MKREDVFVECSITFAKRAALLSRFGNALDARNIHTASLHSLHDMCND